MRHIANHKSPRTTKLYDRSSAVTFARSPCRAASRISPQKAGRLQANNNATGMAARRKMFVFVDSSFPLNTLPDAL